MHKKQCVSVVTITHTMDRLLTDSYEFNREPISGKASNHVMTLLCG